MAEILYKELSYQVVGAAMEVHKVLGPAFVEPVYQKAYAHELYLRAIPYEEQKLLPVHYKGQFVGEYRADFVIDNKIIIEIKAVSSLNEIHDAQAINYLAATGLRVAILINFGEKSLKTKRIAK
jgi:GxxExxY protein